MSASWYDVLGVPDDASNDEIRDAWKSSIADLDPTDRRFGLYNDAASVLLDPGKRAAYDAERAGSEAAAPAPVTEPVDPAAPDASTSSGSSAAAAIPGIRLPRSVAGRALPALGTRALAALAVAAALVLGAALALQLTNEDAAATESSLADARQAAEANLPKVFTYDYRFPERDRDRAARVLTGDLREDYESLWDEAIAPNLERTEGSATSQVVGSGAVKTTDGGEKAEVLVVLDSVTGNAQGKQQLTLALTATMVQQDGEWLIEEIDGWDPEAVEDGSESPTTPEGEGSSEPSPSASSPSESPTG